MVGAHNFETITEYQFPQKLGADAVGMSTVPGVIVARHCGISVFGFPFITNKSVLDYKSQETANHEELLMAGHLATKELEQLVCTLLENMQPPSEKTF
uniref:purine-nucleoside phosphorylase n=1 Tax=Vombatus ursinus TaxID=29139 RepID=A0A4X2KZ29_VOMUR